jgi:hypothetical protein
VAVVGSKLVTIESQLATARYQNQGLKALLSRVEGKHEEATKQLAKERSVSLFLKNDNTSECWTVLFESHPFPETKDANGH